MRILLAALLGAGALLSGASSVGAASVHHPMGIVLPRETPPTGVRSGAAPRTSDQTCDGSDCTTYEGAINQYFTDVAHDSGGSSNVYSVATQYSDSTGSIAYDSTFGGSYVDTTAYPHGDCREAADTVCLDESQLANEIEADIAANSWPTGTSSLFFIFTPDNVGICFDDESTCSGTDFCAFHDYTGSTADPTIYAVEPENASLGYNCDPGQAPNGNGADPTINTVSHEMNEAITDPELDAWYSNDGNEEADLCAWTFGTPLGTTESGGEYNQVINGHDYWLQEEYSNADALAPADGCVKHLGATPNAPYNPIDGSGPLVYQADGPVMRMNTIYAIYWVPTAPPPPPPPSPPANTGAPAVSGTTAVGKTLTTSSGSWSNSPTGFSYKWEDCSAGGTSCATIAGATGASYALTAGDAGFEIRSEVSASNSGGSSGFTASAASDVVVPVPAVTVAPAVSGVAAVGQTLSTTEGTWNTPVTVTYEWLRCIGASCGYIANAQAATYQATSADAGRTLEARVLATNAAGTTAAVTAPTVVVIDVPKASSLTHITGTAKVGKKLAVANGTWTNSPTSFSYQWLRCSAKGSSCAPISGATRASYTLGKKDAKHRLRVQVSAVNAAGTTSVRSAATKTVQPKTTR